MELIFTERMRICMASHDLGGLQFGLLLPGRVRNPNPDSRDGESEKRP